MSVAGAFTDTHPRSRTLAAALSEGCDVAGTAITKRNIRDRPGYTYFHNKRILDAPRSALAQGRRYETFGSRRPSPVSENITRASLITANNKDNAAVTLSRIQRIKLIQDDNTGYVTSSRRAADHFCTLS